MPGERHFGFPPTEQVIDQCLLLTKENSRDAKKQYKAKIIATPWSNIKQTAQLPVGTITFNDLSLIKNFTASKKLNVIIPITNKTDDNHDENTNTSNESDKKHNNNGNQSENDENDRNDRNDPHDGNNGNDKNKGYVDSQTIVEIIESQEKEKNLLDTLIETKRKKKIKDEKELSKNYHNDLDIDCIVTEKHLLWINCKYRVWKNYFYYMQIYDKYKHNYNFGSKWNRLGFVANYGHVQVNHNPWRYSSCLTNKLIRGKWTNIVLRYCL